jgi:sensor c-di-GMP phosphodiesterase-like protein
MTIDLAKELGEALETSQIAAYFQPLVDLRRRQIVGFEVLARWTHPQLGTVPPDTFILLTEER